LPRIFGTVVAKVRKDLLPRPDRWLLTTAIAWSVAPCRFQGRDGL